ncbi:uncharacterized protein LOC127528851 isoform X2 [Erpetoichthys calabaricus]|uniref:uncharacterized protein LOC127528851 isoform X2 n=1 Tax=Erpetoichthys calabaricus TaxID=27687 RepID=UPI00223416AB|nr:uncharacterized protein LOC127528851 isoform X2 [Erpetoichthys calabaricus]
MHHFADASEDGYGTVTYLVLTNKEGKKHCSFLMGKLRVAPLKQITIPRLELTAAVVAVKMDKMFKGELQMPLEESTFWTDSTMVLKYISNESTRFKTFVANRISVIRDHSQPSQWRYVTSALNPADQASRGLSIENFLKSTTWSQGPTFLLKPEREWPKRPDQPNDSLLEDDPEVKSCTVNMTKIEEATEPINKLITYFSDWHRLKKAVAWFLKFKDLMLSLRNERKTFQLEVSQTKGNPEEQKSLIAKHMKRYKLTLKTSPISLDDLVKAETELIRLSQQQEFPVELKF